MPAQARKTPQDHKPKATDGFQFTGADGKTYTLPSPAGASHLLTIGMVRKARRGDQAANIDLIFTVLEGVADEPTLEAIDALPADKGTQIILDWFHSVSGGASLGE
jgi:hypothetical protein